MEWKLSDLLSAELSGRAEVIETSGDFETRISGMEYDSRKVQPGNLFFALPGLHADGRRFIPEALRRGAAAIVYEGELDAEGLNPRPVLIRVKSARFAMSPLADAFYGSPSRRLKVIGVTGTEGKSTTVYLVFQLLRLLAKRAGFISTVQYCEGNEVLDNPEHQTTPEATAVHKSLAAMLENACEYAVVESSSHGLSPRTNRLGDVAFDVGIMTNVTHEHLEFHGTWEQYRDDKANLFRAAEGFCVVNADDPSAAYFTTAAKVPVQSFSVKGRDADLSLQSIESGPGGNAWTVLCKAGGETLSVKDNLPGAFNAGNVLAALLAVSGLTGTSIPGLIPLVPALEPVRGRMTAVNKGQPFEVLVDYAHTPSSFETIYPPLRKQADERGARIISVFGSAGERDTAKRPQQGVIASKYSDIIILTDEDPRGEDSLSILNEIAKGVYADNPKRSPGEDLFFIPPRPEAICKAFSLARPGDIVLLLGKGHENSVIYADGPHDYDEIKEAEAALHLQ